MTRATRYVALWRAVNLGGHHRLAMEDLRQGLASLGFLGVRTVLQTGNAVFDSSLTSPQIETRLEALTAERWSIATPVMVRTAAEWQAIIDENPLADACAAAPGRAVVMCLKSVAGAASAAALARVLTGPECAHVAGGHVYLVYPDGIGTSKLTPAVIERALGTPGTSRNWNTVVKVGALLRG